MIIATDQPLKIGQRVDWGVLTMHDDSGRTTPSTFMFEILAQATREEYVEWWSDQCSSDLEKLRSSAAKAEAAGYLFYRVSAD